MESETVFAGGALMTRECDRGEPPDLFWSCRIRTSRRCIRQIDWPSKFASQPEVDPNVDPETTNIKSMMFVARC